MSRDPKLLFQAFGNLISNAVKYSLGCARVVVHCGTDNGEIVVTVEDSGRAIAFGILSSRLCC
jgi:signal transduction histidine kinase